jgi:hypothetical protein
MGVTSDDCLEVGRWTVAPEARGTAVGRTLVVGAWAIGRWLDKRRLIATVGNRDGQATMLTRYGGQFLPLSRPRYFAEYDDELTPMYFDLDQPPAKVLTRLALVRQLLNLPE